MTFVDLAHHIEMWDRWHPEEVAVRCDERDVTWAELAERTQRAAGGLQARGVRAGDRVAILSGNSIDWCVMAIAVFRAGGILVPINVRHAAPEVTHALEDAGCSVVAVDVELHERCAPALAANPGLLTISLDGRAPAAVRFEDLDGPYVRPRLESTHPAVIAYSSGTTGFPKGVVLSHGALDAAMTMWRSAEGWTRATAMLCCVPLAFTGGLVNNFLCIYGAGGTLVLERSFDPRRALELILKTPVTAMVGVPIMWEQIAAQPGFVGADLSALTTAITGGSPVPERLLSTYQDKRVAIRQAYALTEVAGTCCLLPARDALTMRQSAGVPLTHTAVMVDADADGDVGEICVRGPQVMTAYWGRPQDTAEALADGWLRTGDLGRLDARGYLEVVDRKKDMIISGGLNVYPAEVEAAVGTFPGVAEVGAFGVPDDRWGETVAISVAGTGLDVDALLDHCRARLGDYKVPRHVELRTEPLPRSMSGKILRRELRASFAAR